MDVYIRIPYWSIPIFDMSNYLLLSIVFYVTDLGWAPVRELYKTSVVFQKLVTEIMAVFEVLTLKIYTIYKL